MLPTGKIKFFAGIKRERAPFIFTPDFAYVLGGKDSAKFSEFVNLCCQSYNILRRHSHLFINLFAMMLSTSIPELQVICSLVFVTSFFLMFLYQTVDDIAYLRRALMIDLDDTQATTAFTSLMYPLHVLLLMSFLLLIPYMNLWQQYQSK